MKEKNVNISVILLDTKVFKKNSIEIEKFVRDNKAYIIQIYSMGKNTYAVISGLSIKAQGELKLLQDKLSVKKRFDIIGWFKNIFK